jgi:hypothetical protein
MQIGPAIGFHHLIPGAATVFLELQQDLLVVPHGIFG